jgi:quinol-cytochrome oxidoreductase complex cytochrome b subunit
VTGAVAFIGSIATAFTGYLSQTNFDSQWTAGQAKDGLNAVGVGAVFNVLDTGQMLMWHVMLLPLLVGVLVIMHVILVRRHGVVPPFGAEPPGPGAVGPSADGDPSPPAAGPLRVEPPQPVGPPR